MDHKSLVKSSKDQAIVGDMGSRPENECLGTWSVVGVGSEEGIREYAHKALQGHEIVHEEVKVRPDGKLFYEARIRSKNGIPDAFKNVNGVVY